MTRKDYNAIAGAIKSASLNEPESYGTYKGIYKEGFNDARYEISAKIAEYLSADNPRFDRVKFINACVG